MPVSDDIPFEDESWDTIPPEDDRWLVAPFVAMQRRAERAEAALRAALAARPQPLFEGRVVDATASARFTIQADSGGMYPAPQARVVVYAAVAGSAAPTGDD